LVTKNYESYDLVDKGIKTIDLYLFSPMIFGKNNFLQKINLFLGNLPLLKLFAFRYVIVGEK